MCVMFFMLNMVSEKSMSHLYVFTNVCLLTHKIVHVEIKHILMYSKPLVWTQLIKEVLKLLAK